VIALNEVTASAGGALTTAKVVGIALNTRHLDPEAAAKAIEETRSETRLPTVDPVRNGGDVLADAILSCRPGG